MLFHLSDIAYPKLLLRGKVIVLIILLLGLLGISIHSYAKNISQGRININTASLYQLTLLPGVGEATAKKIILSRNKQLFSDNTDLRSRQLIREDYAHNTEKFIIFQGPHQYQDPNSAKKEKSGKKNKQKSTQKTRKKAPRKNKYAIDKAINIEDAQRIKLLTDRTYFFHLTKTLAKAKEEIWLSTFVFKTTHNTRNKANQIVQLLIKKAKQGVAVKLLLEQSNYHKDLSQENHRLAKKLRRHDIQVFFDSMNNTMHSKVVVIDRKYVFLGSHNMTDSALHRNHETSLMLESNSLSSELVHYFEWIAKEQ